MSRRLQHLIGSHELHDFPNLSSTPEGAVHREQLLQRFEDQVRVAQTGANLSWAILAVASELNPAILGEVSSQTQEQILYIKEVTPGELLTELVLRHQPRTK